MAISRQIFNIFDQNLFHSKENQKLGFLMLWIPEPTGVTVAVGAPMILAGRYLDKKYNGSTLKDIGHSTHETISSINQFKASF